MELKIQGVPIHFPYKPYGCQLSMLNRVVTALNNKQGCLLESPTGTGKTLALLCATLGWLEHQTLGGSKVVQQTEVEHLKTCELSSSLETEQDDDFGDFMEDKVQKNSSTCTCGATEFQMTDKNVQIPRIIYATRTHKQISQVIRELRKTKYNSVNMCILSSRRHSCIHPDVRKQGNPNDACQNMKGNCPFDLGKNRQHIGRHMRSLCQNGPWDLEDYVDAMGNVPTCPYFFAFKLLERCTLCFCPYNYLLDPVFRETVASEISGSVIVIDEAHNIEDAARAATSVTLLEREVLSASEDLKRYLDLLKEWRKADDGGGILAKDVTALISLLSSIHQVMMLTRPRLVAAGSFASSSQVWSGAEIGGLLSTVGLGVDRFEALRTSFNRLNNTIQKEAASNRDSFSRSEVSKSPSSATIRLFTYIFTMLKFIYNDNMRRIHDYRAVLMEVVDFERRPLDEDVNSSNSSLNRWLNKARGGKTRLVENKSLSLNFWCLSPAVCMRNLAANTHSLILASGTLAPLDALVAELRLPFPIRLEAAHVVPTERVFAACVARGPQGSRLCATYAHQSAFIFQDDVGDLILEACQHVPGGVLCFFPSYSLLDKMITRWELTGLLNKLTQVKHILREPRSSDKFDDWMTEYQDAINSTSGASPGEPTGAVALAVCRGKISEGLDFADDYGRLVIVVGIPFPAFKDPQIEQKRAFNDALRSSNPSLYKVFNQPNSPSTLGTSFKRSMNEASTRRTKILARSPETDTFKFNPPSPFQKALMDSPTSSTEPPSKEGEEEELETPNRVLSGSEWYEAQAYRALNQALGRCIRHRGDWGAIILAEARFVEQPQRYLPGISRWLRNQFVAHDKWKDLLPNLDEFVSRMSGRPEKSSTL